MSARASRSSTRPERDAKDVTPSVVDLGQPWQSRPWEWPTCSAKSRLPRACASDPLNCSSATRRGRHCVRAIRRSASGGGNRLRLRRPALPQEDRQDDQRADRQELALPVLERLEPELRRPEVARRARPPGAPCSICSLLYSAAHRSPRAARTTRGRGRTARSSASSRRARGPARRVGRAMGRCSRLVGSTRISVLRVLVIGIAATRPSRG